MAKISHILLKNPVVVPTGTKLVDVAKIIQRTKIGSVLVSKNGILTGIVSVEDIISSMAERKDMEIVVEEVMHFPDITIDSEKWLWDAISMIDRYKVSYITVVENGENVGIIRADDILHTYRFNKEDSYNKYNNVIWKV